NSGGSRSCRATRPKPKASTSAKTSVEMSVAECGMRGALRGAGSFPGPAAWPDRAQLGPRIDGGTSHLPLCRGSAHRAGLWQRLPRDQRAEINGAPPERGQALAPAFVEHEIARIVEAHVVAGNLVLLGLGPGELPRVEGETERLEDGLEGGSGIA